MPRARNIKPGFYENDALAECSLAARYIFPGLWMLADKQGRLEDRPKKIKAQLLPYDNLEVSGLLQELHNHSFITRYTINNESFIQINNFTKHQNPHKNEKESEIPPMEKGGIKQDVTSVSSNYAINPEMQQTNPADSFLLIPDSLIPDSLIPDSLIPDSRNQVDYESEFLEFKKLYPLQGRGFGNGKDAKAKFLIARKKATLEEMLSGLFKYTEYIKTTGQSNKDAFRWLEKDSWKDDYIIPNIGNNNGNKTGFAGECRIDDSGANKKPRNQLDTALSALFRA